MGLQITKTKEVPGVLTRWQVVARGGRRTYSITTYPDSAVLSIEDSRLRKINAPKLEAEIRAALGLAPMSCTTRAQPRSGSFA